MIYPDDIITAILTEMNIEDFPVKLDMYKFHTEIYKYSKQHPEIFKEFLFDTNGTFPYSELLERIFQRYNISGVIEKCRGKDTFIKGHNKYFYKYTMNNFDNDTYRVMETIGKELRKKFSE
jgi:hypothetical protein